MFSQCYKIFCGEKVSKKFIFGLIFKDYIWIIQDLFTTDPFIVLEKKQKKQNDEDCIPGTT